MACVCLTTQLQLWAQENPEDVANFAKSTVVTTSAPREMGSLRAADGQEDGKAAHAAKLAANVHVAATSNGVH